jgi:hypothetical protein
MIKLDLPSDKTLATKIIEAEHEHASRVVEMGKIGQLLGSRENAVIYLAAFVIMISVIAGAVLAYVEASLRPDMAKACAAIAISALGYMFGSGGRPTAGR